MKSPPTTGEMTFGEFIVDVYDGWSEPAAGAVVRLAVDAGLVVFRLPKWSHRLPEGTRIEVASRLQESFRSSN